MQIIIVKYMLLVDSMGFANKVKARRNIPLNWAAWLFLIASGCYGVFLLYVNIGYVMYMFMTWDDMSEFLKYHHRIFVIARTLYCLLYVAAVIALLADRKSAVKFIITHQVASLLSFLGCGIAIGVLQGWRNLIYYSGQPFNLVMILISCILIYYYVTRKFRIAKLS